MNERTNTNTPQRYAAGYELYDLMAFAARAWPYSDYMKRYVASTWSSAAPCPGAPPNVALKP
jgi:hypothetical protein